ncbi:MAG: hypothetical protein KDA83_12025 [Planctomycetales bacterium]|nr:hypothetical protein [Planctomycetales bacterium]
MAFDPYREWLQLPGGRPNAFALLGVSHRETDSTVIHRAAEARLNQLRAIRPGDQIEAWQKVLAEIERARDILSDADQRSAYLTKLKHRAAASKAGVAQGSERSRASVAATPASVASGGRPDPATTAPTTLEPTPSVVEDESADLDPFDPMAPLAAPRPIPANTPGPNHAGDPAAPLHAEPLAANSGINGLPGTENNSSPMGGSGSAPGSIAAKHREYLKRRRMIRLGIAASLLVVVAILGGVGYAQRESLLAALGVTSTNSEEVAGPSNPSNNGGDSSTNDPGDSTDSENGDEGGANTNTTDPNGPDTDDSQDDSDDSSSGTGTDMPPEDEDPMDGGSMTDDETRDDDDGSTEPSMEDGSMSGEDDDPMSDDPRELTRPEAYAVSKAAAEVLSALRDGNDALVDERLEYLRLMTDGTEQTEWIDHLQEVVDTNREFWEVVAECVGQLESTEDLEVTPSLIVKVVEATPQKLVYRVAGTREERAPRELPAGLARYIVEYVREGSDDNGRLIGALYAAESSSDSAIRDRAEAAWRESETAGVNVEPLLAWLGDDFESLATMYPPAEMPEEDEIEAARTQLEADYADLLDEARTPDDRVNMAQIIFADATTWDATPEAYARFALASELTASSGLSTQLEPILRVWETWFKLDRFTVLADLLSRSAKMSAPPEECRNTVEMAMQAAQQAIGRKRGDEAEKLLDAALDAAQKSRDAELRSTTLQQVRTLRARLKEAMDE